MIINEVKWIIESGLHSTPSQIPQIERYENLRVLSGMELFEFAYFIISLHYLQNLLDNGLTFFYHSTLLLTTSL